MENKSAKQKRLVAAFLCYILGWLGVHRFYVGKNTSATVQASLWVSSMFFLGLGRVIGLLSIVLLAGFILFIVGMWGLIDLIMILIGKFTNDKGERLTEWT